MHWGKSKSLDKYLLSFLKLKRMSILKTRIKNLVFGKQKSLNIFVQVENSQLLSWSRKQVFKVVIKDI